MTDLVVRDVVVRLGSGRQAVTAVDGVALDLPAGACLGLVGESGSGKSTLARAIVGLERVRDGQILLDGRDYARAGGPALKQLRRRVQLVFQDPRASLNPRMTVGEAIGEGIGVVRRLPRRQRDIEVGRLLEQVALDPVHARSRPAALSGGQRQRVALARALAVQPEIIIADKVTASLDVSVQGSVLNLLHDLRRETGLSLLAISHNLATVRYLSDSIAVMHLGRIVEHGTAEDLLAGSQHPYTRMLVESGSLKGLADAGPVPDIDPPDALHPPSGCRFHEVCPVGPRVRPERTVCVEEDPRDEAERRLHGAACHFVPLAAQRAERFESRASGRFADT
jgi:peptide/nickel transport system ATP-binding protein